MKISWKLPTKKSSRLVFEFHEGSCCSYHGTILEKENLSKLGFSFLHDRNSIDDFHPEARTQVKVQRKWCSRRAKAIL